jgi:7-dehydrocholesterol reductase
MGASNLCSPPLILLCPPTVFLFWYTNVELGGSFTKLGELFAEAGVLTTIKNVWAPYFFGSTTAWIIIATFAGFELLLIRFLPGEKFEGPITPAGNIPIYKANGFLAFVTTMALYIFATYGLKLFSPTLLYDHFPYLLGALNLFSLLFCLFLLVKGYWYPSSTDAGSSGNLIFDFYW